MNDLKQALLSSSQFFCIEATKNAISASEGNTDRWQLALLHLVTAVEHSSKALLAEVHPAFIRENIDRAGKSVGIEKAFARLSDKEILGVAFTEKDMKRIHAAIRLRNDIAHGALEIHSKALEAKFFEVFAFQREILKFRFDVSIDSLLEIDDRRKLQAMKRHNDELMRRAIAALRDDTTYFSCNDCLQEFMEATEEKFVCLFCHWEEPLTLCERCHHAAPAWELLDASELFEYEFSEGLANLVTDYGIHVRQVCGDCFQALKTEVSDAREAQEIEEWENFFYATSQRN